MRSANRSSVLELDERGGQHIKRGLVKGVRDDRRLIKRAVTRAMHKQHTCDFSHYAARRIHERRPVAHLRYDIVVWGGGSLFPVVAGVGARRHHIVLIVCKIRSDKHQLAEMSRSLENTHCNVGWVVNLINKSGRSDRTFLWRLSDRRTATRMLPRK